MSVADVDICDVRSVLATGDCDIPKQNSKEDISGEKIVTDILSEVVENALDIALHKPNYTDAAINIVGDIWEKKQIEASSSKNLTSNQNAEESLPSIGVGDQLQTEEIISSDVCNKHPLLEKKNRLTDLVRNSKQILAKFLNENKQQQEQDVKNEQFLQVIELDCVPPGAAPFKAPSKVFPETIPLPDEDSDELNEVPDDSKMDVIQLCKEMKDGGGDDCKKRMTFPIAAGPSKTKGFIAKCRTLKIDSAKLKEKKWNLGSKLINYIRKHHQKKQMKQQDQEAENNDNL